MKILNKYEIVNEYEHYSDRFRSNTIYIDEYSFLLELYRIDHQDGWGQKLKCRIYSINDEEQSYEINLGPSESFYICKQIDINKDKVPFKLYRLDIK